MRLLSLLFFTNLTFWLLWPASIVSAAKLGWGAAATGLFGSATWLLCLVGLWSAPGLIRLLGIRQTSMLAALLMAAAALGLAITEAGSLSWLWVSTLGLGLGFRWIAVDAWLAVEAPKQLQGRALSMSETLAGVTFMTGPILAAYLQSMTTIAIIGLWCSGFSIVLAFQSSEPTNVETSKYPRDNVERSRFSNITAVVMAAALWGGLFESGFSATASLLSLEWRNGSKSALVAVGVTGAGSFIAQYGFGVLSDRFGGRTVLVALSLILTTTLTMLFLTPPALLPVSFIVGAVGGGLYTVSVITAVQAETNTSRVPHHISRMAILYTVGTLVAPFVSGVIIDALGGQVQVLLMISASAALAIWLVFEPES